jgi:hypothetical protein
MDRRHRVVAEAHPLGPARDEVLEHDVALRRELRHDGAPALVKAATSSQNATREKAGGAG